MKEVAGLARGKRERDRKIEGKMSRSISQCSISLATAYGFWELKSCCDAEDRTRACLVSRLSLPNACRQFMLSDLWGDYRCQQVTLQKRLKIEVTHSIRPVCLFCHRFCWRNAMTVNCRSSQCFEASLNWAGSLTCSASYFPRNFCKVSSHRVATILEIHWTPLNVTPLVKVEKKTNNPNR